MNKNHESKNHPAKGEKITQNNKEKYEESHDASQELQNHSYYYPSPPHLISYFPRGIPLKLIKNQRFVDEILFPKEIFGKIDRIVIKNKLKRFRFERVFEENLRDSDFANFSLSISNHADSLSNDYENGRGRRFNEETYQNNDKNNLLRHSRYLSSTFENQNKPYQASISGGDSNLIPKSRLLYGRFRFNGVSNELLSYPETTGFRYVDARFKTIKLKEKEIIGFY